MSVQPQNGLSTLTKILGLIGVMAGAGGALITTINPIAGQITIAIAVMATAGAHFTG